MTDGTALEVHDLTKRFGSFLALDHVSFQYSGHRVVGYLGPNGAGKTTTLKILTGLLRATSGQALVGGYDVRKHRREALRQVGAVIETPEPYPQLTGREALDMVADLRGIPTAERAPRYAELTEQLDLPPLDRRCGQLSKGQRQRVVIASVLLPDPPVLILDEPTSGLDPAERIRVRTVIQRLKRDRLVLMSSHLLDEVRETCDDVMFVNGGKLLLSDRVSALGERFRANRVDVEFSAPVAVERVGGVGHGVVRVDPITDRHFRLTFEGDADPRTAILRACLELGPVVSFTPGSAVLEDAYLSLMQENGGRPLAPPPPPAPSR